MLENSNAIRLSLLLLLIAAPIARAANPDWSAGYPKTGTNNGTILVKGTLNLAATEETAGTVSVIAYPTTGGVVKSFGFTIVAGQNGPIDWDEFEITSLTSNLDYYVVVQISCKTTATGGSYTVATPPGTAKAK